MGRKKLGLIIFLVGLSILLYPIVSQYWNSKRQSRAIASYDKIFAEIDNDDIDNMFKKVDEYNQELFHLQFPLIQYKELSNYFDLIDVNGNGMMGYITIDKLKIKLPIYHGTSSSVLNVAVGHLEGSSLPIGGESTHSVLSAHRGLPSSKLFTNLNKLEIGDTFIITILDRNLMYQVDNIVTVEPNDISELEIVNGKDLVTLMTCTPYSINTHRLLVRGTRMANVLEEPLTVMRDAYAIDRLVVTLIISLFIFLVLIIYVLINPRKKKSYEEEV